MFTGLIETTGQITSLTPGEGATRIIVHAPALTGRWRIGDSIAVNGTCLTALDAGHDEHFAADLAAETLARTTLGSLTPGTTVNLELPTPAGSPLGGHVVQGHVDATATLVSLVPLHDEIDRHRLASHRRTAPAARTRRSSHRAPSHSTASVSPSPASTVCVSRSPSSRTPTQRPTCTRCSPVRG